MASTGYPRPDSASDEPGLLRELLTSLPAALAYVAGPEMVFEFASEGYRRVFGGCDLIGQSFREALPDLVGQQPFQALRRVLETGEPGQDRGEEVWVRRNGGQPEPIWVDSVYQPVRDKAGDVAGALILSTDVSDHVRDRHLLEELTDNLQRSEERYRTLFETSPYGIIHCGRDGCAIEANPAAVDILGLAPYEMTPQARARQVLHEDGTPCQPDELPVMIALRTGEMVSGLVFGVRNARTGELRWVRNSAVPDALDSRNRPRRAYTVFIDITRERQAQAAMRESSRLLERLWEANVVGVVVANEKGIEDANDAFLDIIGYTRGDLEAGHLTWGAITPEEFAGVDEKAIEQMRGTGASPPYEKEHRHRDGHRVPVLIGVALLDRDPLRWAKIVVDLTARQRREQERAELQAREQAAQVEADAARQRLTLLLEAGNLVAATGSQEELREQLARLMVPSVADCCAVLLMTATGTLRAVSVVHRDPAKTAILDGLRPLDIPADGPLMRATLTRGATHLVTDASTILPRWPRAARPVTDILMQVPIDSMVIMPLLVGQRPAGAVVLGRDHGRLCFTRTDMAVIEELARRLATGLANVEAFAREHTVAETLQRALMPDDIPQIPGLDLAALYLPATDGVHVGGDWYEVFPLGHDKVGLVIGDVAGHSIGSASVMGQIRSLVCGYALEHQGPAGVLARTNAAVCQRLPDAYATVFYALLDLRAGHLTYASAGHPPALLHGRDGHAEYLAGATGPMLGASPEAGYPAGYRRLASGARLLLYTDGLIEDRRQDITVGLDALARAARGCLSLPAGQACQCVQAAMLGSGPRDDDVCLLAVSLLDQPAVPRPRRAEPTIATTG